VIFAHCCILYQKDVCLEVSRTIHTSNMACSTLWLQCRCTAVTPNQFYIVGGHSYWCMDYAWGCHFQWYTMGYAPKFTALAVAAPRRVLWYTTIDQEGWASCIESTPALMKSIKVSYYEWSWLWDTFMASYVWRRMCVIGGTNKAMTTWSTIWPLTLLKMSSIIIISSRQTSNKYLNFGFYTYLYSYLNSWDGRRGACCKAKCTHQQLHDHPSLVAAYSSASAKFLH